MSPELREVPAIRKSLGDRLDDTVSFFFPRRGAQRKAWRAAGRAVTALGYRGANRDNRLHSDWIPGHGSADADLLTDLPELRERSRDLIRLDGHAAGVALTMTNNTIGTGIVPQSRIDRTLGLDPRITAELQNQIEAAWNIWMPHADAGNRLQWADVLEQIDQQILANGESFVAARRLGPTEDKWRPFRFCQQLIESDRVDTPPDQISDKNVRAGVRLGTRGEPLGYYIRRSHPGDITVTQRDDQTYDYFPARDPEGRPLIWHLYHQRRPGQTRGVPFFAPVIDLFKHLADYMEAEVVAARVAACFSVFIKKQNAFDAALQRSSVTPGTTKRRQTVEPGLIEYLEPDESIETFNPTRPGAGFDAFVIRVLRTIGAALGLPYELTAKDFSKTNYSSARAALLEARKYFRFRQAWLARLFCQPTYELVIEEAYLQGLLSDPAFGRFMSEKPLWTRARWVYPGWDWLDPLKEVQASKEAIKSGLSTQADENATRGLDWEATNEQQQRETEDRRARNLPTWWEDTTPSPPPGQTTEDNQPEENEPEENEP